MPVHVGWDPSYNKLSYIDDDKKKIVEIKIDFVYSKQIEIMDALFKEIQSQTTGDFGCICFNSYSLSSNDLRENYIKCALDCGFKSVELINFDTNFYLNSMLQINYKPLNGDVIWILNFGVYVWIIKNHKAHFLCKYEDNPSGVSEIEEIFQRDLSTRPNIVIYHSESDVLKLLQKPQSTSACKFFTIDRWYSYSRGLLLKAQINAGNIELASLDIKKYLSQNIYLQMGTKEIKLFKYGEPLPIVYTLKNDPDIKFIAIIPERGSKEKVELPPQRNNLYFYIDENEISSVGSEETLHQVQNHGNSINMNDQLKQSAEKKNLERQRHEPIKNRILSKEDNQATSHFQPKIEAKCSNICYNFPQKATAKSEGIGIDLGTTRCCVAVNRNGVIITIPLDSTGERLLPSYISYDEEMVKCGKVVVGRLQYHSNSTIFDSKRIIGRTFNDVKIEENWDFNVICDNEAVLLETYGFNGKTKFTAVEAAADLLKYIKKRAEEFEGKQITKAVITVPAAFSDSQKFATEAAAKEAGWTEVQLLPEPIAAAFAYYIERPIPNNSIVLLFDLGGGTLDVCIFKVENDSMKIISNTGDTQIGGRDFDTILMNYFENVMYIKSGFSISNDKKFKLLFKCQRIKENLSSMTESFLDIDEFDPSKSNHGIFTVTSVEFRLMTQTLLNKILKTIITAMMNANLTKDQIYQVLHVGGGSRMPMIKGMLKDLFPNAQHRCEVHPDEVVAVGAAYYANSIFPE